MRAMRVVGSLLVGTGAACGAVALSGALHMMYLMTRLGSSRGTSAGALGVASGSIAPLGAIAALAFVAAFYWWFRRAA